MRALLLLFVAGCSSHHGEVPCADAVAHAVKFSDAKDRGELVEMLTTQCTEEAWPASTRACLVAAKSAPDVAACNRTLPHSAATVSPPHPDASNEEHGAPDAAPPAAPGEAAPHTSPQ